LEQAVALVVQAAVMAAAEVMYLLMELPQLAVVVAVVVVQVE
jgi:hypothetical protein